MHEISEFFARVAEDDSNGDKYPVERSESYIDNFIFLPHGQVPLADFHIKHIKWYVYDI